MSKTWLAAVSVLLAIVGWQEFVNRKQQGQIRNLRNAAVSLQQPEEINDSTQIVMALNGVLLKRDREIIRLKRELKLSTRAQLDMKLSYEADVTQLNAEFNLLVDEITSAPLGDSLHRYTVPFSVAMGDSNQSAQVEGQVKLIQPGTEFLNSIGVKLTRLSLETSLQIDLVESEYGWSTIVQSSTSALMPTVKLAVSPRKILWHERVKFSAGLGFRKGSPLVYSGVHWDPWGLGITAGGGVGIFVYKTF